MNLTPTDLAAIGAFVIGAIILAGYDDKRWYRYFRRLRGRNRTWKQFSNGRRPVAGSSSHLCDRANNEYRVDRPTRSIP